MGKFICLCGARCVIKTEKRKANPDKVQCPHCKQKYFLSWKQDVRYAPWYIAQIIKHENIDPRVAK